MARSARRPEPLRDEPRGLARAAGAVLFANPVAVGGATAFAVAFAFVSANALWYQPHRHAGAFVTTRTMSDDADRGEAAKPQTSIRIQREADLPPPPKPDPLVREVQAALATLGHYAGTIDGLDGPRTRAAVEAYQKVSGLAPDGRIDAALRDRLTGTAPAVVATPDSAPTPAFQGDRTTTASVREPDPIIVQIQAGLRAFGHNGIELDGLAGAKTRSAIREFQSLFGLPVNGEPDEALLAKMRDVGLTN